MKRIRVLAPRGAALVLAAGLLVGCSHYQDERGKGDAPVKGRAGEDTAAEVYNFPDGFGNLATKCVGHGMRAYVTTNTSGPSNVQIVPDKSCAN